MTWDLECDDYDLEYRRRRLGIYSGHFPPCAAV